MVQIEGNEMEFMAYGLLYAAVTNPKQLAMELRGVPCTAWQHPYMEHALRVTSPLTSPMSHACHSQDLKVNKVSALCAKFPSEGLLRKTGSKAC